MGLIQTEYKDLIKLREDVLSGKIDPSRANIAIATYSQQEKRINLVIKILAMQKKTKTRMVKEIELMDLLGKGEAFDTNTCRETEMIRCPNTDMLISRADCLDTSGSHPESCVDCHHNKITKDRLLCRA